MDLTATHDEQRFRDDLRAWLQANLPSRDEERAAGDSPGARFAFLRAWQKNVYEGGWSGVAWPKEYGGRGASLMQQVIFTEEMARARAPQLVGVIGLGLVGPTIISFGTDAQKRRFLPKILSGEEIWCQGFSEPNAGSDLAAVRTDARLEGDSFVLNGQKVWTSFGWIADWCALLVRSDPASARHQGLTFILADMRSPGVDVRPLRQMTGETEFNEVFFTNVRVPVENVVGEIGKGWDVAIGTLMHERATLGAGLQITFRRQLGRLIELARNTDHHGRRAADDPVVRQKLAQSFVEIELLRLNQMRAISRVSATGVPGPEGSILKICWSELNQRFQQVAAEVLGPYAQIAAGDSAIDEGEWAYSYLRARGNTIEAGTSEIQRNIIGHFVLGLPKSY